MIVSTTFCDPHPALARFRKRPPISKLPRGLQRDIREFFGTYKAACEQADQLLFQAGRAEAIDEACQRSPIGKLLPNALYLHRSAVESIEPLLRVYEGCARTYLGEIEDTNLVKLHRVSGNVSYLPYPAFETDPHPALLRSVKLNLRTRLHASRPPAGASLNFRRPGPDWRSTARLPSNRQSLRRRSFAKTIWSPSSNIGRCCFGPAALLRRSKKRRPGEWWQVAK